VRSGLLASHQGTRGGYQLGRAAETISVADVIQAIDGPLQVTACSTDDEQCDQFAKCNVRDPLWRIKERILEALRSSSVAEIAADGVAQPPVHAAVLVR
jgi:Rrf2 family protein